MLLFRYSASQQRYSASLYLSHDWHGIILIFGVAADVFCISVSSSCVVVAAPVSRMVAVASLEILLHTIYYLSPQTYLSTSMKQAMRPSTVNKMQRRQIPLLRRRIPQRYQARCEEDSETSNTSAATPNTAMISRLS